MTAQKPDTVSAAMNIESGAEATCPLPRTSRVQGTTQPERRSRFDKDAQFIEGLTEAHVNALYSVINADNMVALVRKLYRLAVASAGVHLAQEQLFRIEGAELVSFYLELSGYRRFVDRLYTASNPATGLPAEAQANEPLAVANEIVRENRRWLLEVLQRYYSGPEAEAMERLIEASQQAPRSGAEPFMTLLQASVSIAQTHANGDIEPHALESAIAYLQDLLDRRSADGGTP